MTEKTEIYRCELCKMMVEVLKGAEGTLTCCKQPMTLLQANSTEAAQEKHVPQVTAEDGGIRVTVGSVEHPMEAAHFIEWIEVHAGNQIWRHQLKPGDQPTAFFPVKSADPQVKAYCNLHGLWKK